MIITSIFYSYLHHDESTRKKYGSHIEMFLIYFPKEKKEVKLLYNKKRERKKEPTKGGQLSVRFIVGYICIEISTQRAFWNCERGHEG